MVLEVISFKSKHIKLQDPILLIKGKFNLSHCYLGHLDTLLKEDNTPGSLYRAENSKSFSGSWSIRLLPRCLLAKPTWSLGVFWSVHCLVVEIFAGTGSSRSQSLALCTCAMQPHPLLSFGGCLSTQRTIWLLFFLDLASSPFSFSPVPPGCLLYFQKALQFRAPGASSVNLNFYTGLALL